ncbi:MAG: hypothetical protein IJQ68_05795 [Methanobrevibacter sp.]|uniref:hypothetical protein n=1 Tax=Methanobrevibacter sp. TaxID=66852 RepID=UPI0025F3FCB3|nr:hypothetical protein [Methanobrevibacter sp.]MBR0271484.1 hypothetical protein [Methanobrevibacter sp.]
MKDETGNLYIADALIALSILFIALLMLNSLVSIPNPTYSDISHDSKDAQDIMEILGGRVDFYDHSFLSEITSVLKDNRNSKKSIREVSEICDEKFSELKLTNYRFVESNKLDSKVLSSSGDFSKAETISVATRNFDGYSYTLYLW